MTTMTKILWDQPVAANGRLFLGPYDALDFLNDASADRADLHYQFVCRMLAQAADGIASLDEARECFEALIGAADSDGLRVA